MGRPVALVVVLRLARLHRRTDSARSAPRNCSSFFVSFLEMPLYRLPVLHSYEVLASLAGRPVFKSLYWYRPVVFTRAEHCYELMTHSQSLSERHFCRSFCLGRSNAPRRHFIANAVARITPPSDGAKLVGSPERTE